MRWRACRSSRPLMSEDREVLEDLIAAAINDANAQRWASP